MFSEEYKKRITVIDDEEFLERLEVEELLKRYAAGERDFRCFDLSGADLSKLDFGERRSRGITYNKRIYLSHANLSGANLGGINLHNAIMELVDLSNACLEGANLEGAYPEGADLSGANLKGANLCATSS